MIDKTDPLDGKVEAVLLTTMSGDELVKVAHGVYLHVSQFAEVRPVGDDPERIKALKTLRAQVVEESLAAASARSEAAMAKREIEEAKAATRRVGRELGTAVRQLELARAALEYIQKLDAAGPVPPLPFLDVLLPTDGRKGSLDVPCDAQLVIQRTVEVGGCGDPDCFCGNESATAEVGRHPCMLPLGHEAMFPVADDDPRYMRPHLHLTLDGQTFETGETVLVDEDD